VSSTVDIIGPGAIVLVVILIAVGMLSLYVFGDSVRRRAHDYVGVAEGRWFYTLPQGLYFVAFVLAQLPLVAQALPWVGYVQVVGAPIALIQQVAYLLRVVFPTQKRLDARLSAKEAALVEEFGVDSSCEGLDGEPLAGHADETKDDTSS
jgi:hypothetical protein